MSDDLETNLLHIRGLIKKKRERLLSNMAFGVNKLEAADSRAMLQNLEKAEEKVMEAQLWVSGLFGVGFEKLRVLCQAELKGQDEDRDP